MKAREHSAFQTLPEAVFWLIPELDSNDWTEEERADCSDCAMVAKPDESPPRPRTFNPKTRCCTYHPNLANFSIGRLLRDGGRGAELIRQRIADPEGLDGDGLNPQPSRRADDPEGQTQEFGQNERYLCPFFLGGDLACGIWTHREAVCRTWFCLYVDGFRGGELWTAVRNVLSWAEYVLMRWCVKQGSPPKEGDGVEAFEAWFVWCAERLDRASADEIAQLQDDELKVRRDALQQACDTLKEPISDVLVPAVGGFHKYDDGVILYGDSHWDALRAPGSIFQLLSRLDDETPWRDALAEAQKASNEGLDEELVRDLARAGVLLPPGYGEQPLVLPTRTDVDVGGEHTKAAVKMRWATMERPANRKRESGEPDEGPV